MAQYYNGSNFKQDNVYEVEQPPPRPPPMANASSSGFHVSNRHSVAYAPPTVAPKPRPASSVDALQPAASMPLGQVQFSDFRGLPRIRVGAGLAPGQGQQQQRVPVGGDIYDDVVDKRDNYYEKYDDIAPARPSKPGSSNGSANGGVKNDEQHRSGMNGANNRRESSGPIATVQPQPRPHPKGPTAPPPALPSKDYRFSSIYETFQTNGNSVPPSVSSPAQQFSALAAENSRNASLVEGPSYTLDHLATFSRGQQPSSSVRDKEEALQKLSLLMQQGGVWMLRVQLVVGRDVVAIVDVDKKKVLAKFPLGNIFEVCTVDMSKKLAGNALDNLIVLTVLDAYSNKPDELHCFQCIGKSAQVLCNNISDAKAKLLEASQSKSSVEPPRPPKPTASDQSQVKPAVTNRHSSFQPPTEQVPTKPLVQPEAPKKSPSAEPVAVVSYTYDDISVDEKIKRTKKLIDLLFNDVEQFMESLRNAAKKRAELAKFRAVQPKKDKKKDQGLMAMLEKESAGPSVNEFVEVLQKFKLAFITLPLMRSHLTSMSAEDMVHQLFPLLAIVAEASQDPSRPDVQIASRVTTPAMTSGAVNLLSYCLEPAEMALWHSFGDAWNKNRSELAATKLEGYVPTFSNRIQPSSGCLGDWSPIIFGTEDWPKPVAGPPPSVAPTIPRGLPPVPLASFPDVTDSAKPKVNEPIPQASTDAPKPVVLVSRNGSDRREAPTTANNDHFEWTIEQKKYQRKLQNRGARICQAKDDFTSSDKGDLDAKKGEIFEFLDASDASAWRLRNYQGLIGMIPSSCLGPAERI